MKEEAKKKPAPPPRASARLVATMVCNKLKI